jgi:hypothetical protein
MKIVTLAPMADDGRYASRDGWELVDKETGKKLHVGDYVHTSKDERVEITWLNPPHKCSSQGKVCVRGTGDDVFQSQYYASVIGAEYLYMGGPRHES